MSSRLLNPVIVDKKNNSLESVDGHFEDRVILDNPNVQPEVKETFIHLAPFGVAMLITAMVIAVSVAATPLPKLQILYSTFMAAFF